MSEEESVRTKMSKVEDIKFETMPDSNFLKPIRMSFSQNGRQRYWDFVKAHESVSILIFNTSRNVFIFVKQFRPPVYFNSTPHSHGKNSFEPNSVDWTKVKPELGFTIELCAGIVDNPKLTDKEIGKQEVLEECGYDVPLENFEFITCYRNGIGISGERARVFFATVTDEMKVSEGGGNVSEGELIEVIEMTIPEAQSYVIQENVNSPGGFLFAVMYFLLNKAPQQLNRKD